MKLKCGHDNNFVDKTLDNFLLDRIIRHRICADCGMVFETEEKCTGRSWRKKRGVRVDEPDLYDGWVADRQAKKNELKDKELDQIADRVAERLRER